MAFVTGGASGIGLAMGCAFAEAGMRVMLADIEARPLEQMRRLSQTRPRVIRGEAMNFGIFYEHQIPRPWDAAAEHRIYREALEQVELADRIGIDYAWEVEHHFLEEYSHSSAPEVFLAACSRRTHQRIRLGHGIVLMPPEYDHPARVAERIAALDLVSDGRVEFGTGKSASILELGGYRVSIRREARGVAGSA